MFDKIDIEYGECCPYSLQIKPLYWFIDSGSLKLFPHCSTKEIEEIISEEEEIINEY